MGLNFRKSVNLGNGVKLNLGKESVGVSAGVKGARVSVNSKGRKTATVGIPGSGVYYTKSVGGKKKASKKGVIGTIMPVVVAGSIIKAVTKKKKTK